MGIVENAKEAVKLVQKIDNIELYSKIVDLQTEAIELIEQIREKDETIQKLKGALSIKGKLKYMHLAYYIVDENEKVIDGPFCTKCFDVDHLQCRLLPTTRKREGGDWIHCPKCKVPFQQWRTELYLRTGKFERQR